MEVVPLEGAMSQGDAIDHGYDCCDLHSNPSGGNAIGWANHTTFRGLKIGVSPKLGKSFGPQKL